jgi:hypothetical protein
MRKQLPFQLKGMPSIKREVTLAWRMAIQ